MDNPKLLFRTFFKTPLNSPKGLLCRNSPLFLPLFFGTRQDLPVALWELRHLNTIRKITPKQTTDIFLMFTAFY
jgi:hypothetical protein